MKIAGIKNNNISQIYNDQYLYNIALKSLYIIHQFIHIKDYSDKKKTALISSHLFCIMFIANHNVILSMTKKCFAKSFDDFLINDIQRQIIFLSLIEKSKNINIKPNTIYFNTAIKNKFLKEEDRLDVSEELIKFLEKRFMYSHIYSRYESVILEILQNIKLAVSRIRQE